MSTNNQSEDKKIVDEFLGAEYKSLNEDKSNSAEYKTIKYEVTDRISKGYVLFLKTPLLTAMEESIHPQTPAHRKEYLNKKIIPALIRSGADANQTIKGISPLSLAVALKQPAIVDLLLRSGANPNQQISVKNMVQNNFISLELSRGIQDLVTPLRLVEFLKDPASKEIDRQMSVLLGGREPTKSLLKKAAPKVERKRDTKMGVKEKSTGRRVVFEELEDEKKVELKTEYPKESKQQENILQERKLQGNVQKTREVKENIPQKPKIQKNVPQARKMTANIPLKTRMQENVPESKIEGQKRQVVPQIPRSVMQKVQEINRREAAEKEHLKRIESERQRKKISGITDRAERLKAEKSLGLTPKKTSPKTSPNTSPKPGPGKRLK